MLASWPGWLAELVQRLSAAIAETGRRVPVERGRDEQKLLEIRAAMENLTRAIESQPTPSVRLMARLDELEAAERAAEARLKAYPPDGAAELRLPDEAWVRARLSTWAAGLRNERNAAQVLRDAISSITVRAVIAPGKHRGYPVLEFQLRQWSLLLAAFGSGIHPALNRLLAETGDDGESPTFTIALGAPTQMDRWAPQIAAWRSEGVTWQTIVERTGMDLSRAFLAWKRYVGDCDVAEPTQ